MSYPSHKQSAQYVVIGAGAAGLVVAIGLAKAGKQVLLIEANRYGGDCTNYGCIPSKALIHAAKQVHAIKTASQYGISCAYDALNCDQSLAHVRSIVQSIREHEEPPVLAKHGVDCLTGEATFIDSHRLLVRLANGRSIEVSANEIVIATGSRPQIVPIPGLDEVAYRTNETLFELEKIPSKLVILGAGPIGLELAQAFARLGSEVVVIERGPRLLPRLDPDVSDILLELLKNAGVQCALNHETREVSYHMGKTQLSCFDHNTNQLITIDTPELLVATGRQANVESLNLAVAGVATHQFGIVTNDYGQTSVPHIWAAGDVTGKALFTHVAEHQARVVLTNLLVPGLLKTKANQQAIPSITFTDPEVAVVGMSTEEAISKYGKRRIAVYKIRMSEADRAIVVGETHGFVTLVTKKWSGRLLGATIVASRAGEMINEVSLAIDQKIPLRKLAALIHPYPSFNLAIRKAADLWLTKTILGVIRCPASLWRS